VLHPLLAGMGRVAERRRGRVAIMAGGLATLYRERRQVLGRAYAVTVLRFLVMSGGLALLYHLMFGDALWIVVLLVAPVSQLALLLPVAPGGLGVIEGAWYAALTLAGADKGTALAFALAVRAVIVCGTLLAGALALALPGVASLRARRRDRALADSAQLED
jgi:uncharacterized membrane protein YbhN (UPF0104 family)